MRAKKVCGGIITNKKFKEQSLGRELIKAMLSIRSPKDSCWAESLIVLWLDQA